MKLHFRSNDSGDVRWLKHGVERLRQTLRRLQQLLAVDHQPPALALVPIRTEHPRVVRRSHRSAWRD